MIVAGVLAVSELDFVSSSIDETRRLGRLLGELASTGDLYCLEGDLGSGKTSFVQGLGRGLGIKEDINSPTFILANEHRGGRLALYHLDVYRMESTNEAWGIGLDDYLSSEGVCAIEWAEKIRAALPAACLWIEFCHIAETERGLHLKARGPRYEALLHEVGAKIRGWRQESHRGTE
jgi:tRNA threonylcarbamoyladenosine biosynthesis protein TsaE